MVIRRRDLLAAVAAPSKSRLLTLAVRLAPLALGALASYAQAPVSAFWLLPPLIAAATLLHVAAARPRDAALVGWLFGVGYFLPGLVWIGEAFLVDAERFAWMRPFAVTLLPMFLSLYWAAAFAAAAWLSRRLREDDALFGAIALSAIWAAAELARGHLLTGFPWGLFSFGWVDAAAAQSAAWFGTYALNAVIILSGAALAAALRRSGRWRWSAIGLAVVPLAALTLLGWLRLPEPAPDDPQAPLVRLVQPNIPQREKWTAEHVERNLSRLIALSQSPREDGAAPDLVVWPETATPYQVARDTGFRSAVIERMPAGAALVLGSLRSEGEGETRWYNSLFVLGDGGAIDAVYDKHHLVPFGEYLPFQKTLEALGLSQLAWTSGFAAGPGPRVLELAGGLRAAPLICYEAIFPQDMPGPEGRVDLLLQITNDAWFGDSAGPRQHLAQARWRAIEHGVPLLRAANTGISAAIDAHGRVLASAALDVIGIVDIRAPAALAPTLYARYGETGFALILLAFGGLAAAARRRLI